MLVWFLFNLLRAPVKLDRARQQEINGAEQLRREMEAERAAVFAENVELKKPRRPAHEQALYNDIKQEIDGITDGERKFLMALSRGDEMEEQHLRHQLVRIEGFSEEQWLAARTRFRDDKRIRLVEN